MSKRYSYDYIITISGGVELTGKFLLKRKMNKELKETIAAINALIKIYHFPATLFVYRNDVRNDGYYRECILQHKF